MKTIPISEIFLSTQGEGALIGQSTIFVRVGGCDFRCGKCDSLYAVLPSYRHLWTPMTPVQVWADIERLSEHHPLMVTFSGGNPALSPALGEVIVLGKDQGYRFAVETQGSRIQPWFAQVDVLTLSPKAPGMANPISQSWEALDACVAFAGQGPQVVLKIVVFDEVDYQYARQVATRYPQLPMYLQPGNPTVQEDVGRADLLQRLDWLIHRVQQDHWYHVIVLPQMHVLLWGSARGK